MAISSEEERLLRSSITHAIKPRKAFVEANGDSLSTLHYNFIAIKKSNTIWALCPLRATAGSVAISLFSTRFLRLLRRFAPRNDIFETLSSRGTQNVPPLIREGWRG
jgi:hypothetical protein